MKTNALLSSLKLIVVLLFLLGIETMSAETLNAVKIGTPPEIDGIFTDECWKSCPVITGFLPLNPEHVKNIRQTEVKLRFDDANIYLAIRCIEDDMPNIKAKYTERDSYGLFTDDSLEIFVAPDYSVRTAYYYFTVSSNGVVTDYCWPDKGWTGNWKAAVVRGEKEWDAEIRIPFADIGAEKPDLLGMSVCRNRYVGKAEHSYWPIGGSFHRPDGHVLITDYKSWMLKNFIVWDKIKSEAESLSTRNEFIEKNFSGRIAEIIRDVESYRASLVKSEKIQADEFNALLEKVAKAKEELKLLNRKIKMAYAIQALRETTHSKPVKNTQQQNGDMK